MSSYHAIIRFWEEGAGPSRAHPATIAVERTSEGLRLVWCHPAGPEVHSVPLADVHTIAFEWEEDGWEEGE
jgi:hypothetical protein